MTAITIRQRLEAMTYQSSRPGVGERHIPPHTIDALVPVVAALITEALQERHQTPEQDSY